jgi:signal transduction histidine kinase
MLNNNQGNVTLQHNGKLVEGVEIVESWLSKDDNGKIVCMPQKVIIKFIGIKENNIDVEYQIDPKSLEISADVSQIEQILINLVINAIHALKSTKNPLIKINSFLNDNGKVIIQIIDNGSGISDQNKSKIFIRFYSTKKSSGIGLSLCKQIMKLHKGQINVTTVDGSTVFSLSF